MSAIDELFNRAFQEIKEEFDKGKSVPKEDSLVPTTRGQGSVPSVTVPNVRPPSAGRMARKVAEAEQMRQWRMVQTTNRTLLAIESMEVVASHAFFAADNLLGRISGRFYRGKRYEGMNSLASKCAAECLKRGVAGILSFVDSHPKRVAENV